MIRKTLCNLIALYEAERSSAKTLLPGNSLARFAWTLDWALGTEHSITEVRLDNAKERGVPIPPDWVTALRSLKAGEICRGFVGDLQLPTGVANASCNFLGAPKACTPSAQDLGVGRCLAFSHASGRKNFVLVAHVENNEWLCHGGSFIGDSEVPDPLSESTLVLKDLEKDAWDETTAPRRRLTSHAKMQQLINQVQDRSIEFSELVAAATFQAEENYYILGSRTKTLSWTAPGVTFLVVRCNAESV